MPDMKEPIDPWAVGGAQIASRRESDFGQDVSTKKPQASALERWRQVLDEILVEWGRNPGMFEDDEFTPISLPSIKAAFDLLRPRRDKGAPPPSRVLPSPDGGISIEWGDPRTQAFGYEVRPDGSVEELRWRNGALTQRPADQQA